MRLCAVSLLCVLLVLFTFKAVKGYYGQQHFQCFYTQDLNTTEFIYSWYFNKVEHVRYNSTTDKYTGFTDIGIAEAQSLNQNPINSLSFLVGEICIDTRDKYTSIFQQTVKPQVVVRPLRSESDAVSAVLLCTVYDYHPKGVKVSWLRDGRVVTEGVSSTDELSDGDWYYQVHTYLEYIPRPGENISCRVEHESLPQPLIYSWDPSLPAGERNKLIIGIFLLVLGIGSAVAGFLYYMLRSKERPAAQTMQTVSLDFPISETNSEASSSSHTAVIFRK